MPTTSLFNERALELLMHMYQRKTPAKITELIDEMPFGQTAVYNALKALEQFSLVEEEMTKEFPRSRLLRLSEKGKKAVRKLEELAEILELTL